MSDSGLGPFQRALLMEIASRSSEFFLTGGGVLAEWSLRHRRTDDLDLFTTSGDAMSSCDRILRASAEALCAEVEAIITAPDFRRYLVQTVGEATRVDFVRDRAPQLFPKVTRDGVITDSDAEIFVNKICTLVERSEPRDLVDLMLLERLGFRVEDYLERAQEKDGGVSPATLAWLLSSFRPPATPPGGVSAQELAEFAQGLEQRMLLVARPTQ
jgi:hypothetical protein